MMICLFVFLCMGTGWESGALLQRHTQRKRNKSELVWWADFDAPSASGAASAQQSLTANAMVSLFCFWLRFLRRLIAFSLSRFRASHRTRQKTKPPLSHLFLPLLPFYLQIHTYSCSNQILYSSFYFPNPNTPPRLVLLSTIQPFLCYTLPNSLLHFVI